MCMFSCKTLQDFVIKIRAGLNKRAIVTFGVLPAVKGHKRSVASDQSLRMVGKGVKFYVNYHFSPVLAPTVPKTLQHSKTRFSEVKLFRAIFIVLIRLCLQTHSILTGITEKVIA